MNPAQRLLSLGLQHWGQSPAERAAAWQAAFDAIGLDAKMTADNEIIGPQWELAENFVQMIEHEIKRVAEFVAKQ